MGFERKFETDEGAVVFLFDRDGFFKSMELEMKSRQTFKLFPREMDSATTDFAESLYSVLMRKVKIPQSAITEMIAMMRCPLCKSDAILVPDAETESRLSKLCVVCGWKSPEPKLHRKKVHGITEEISICDCGAELIATSSLTLKQGGIKFVYDCKKCKSVYILANEK